MESLSYIVLIAALMLPCVIIVPFRFKGYFNLLVSSLLSFAGGAIVYQVSENQLATFPVFKLPFIGDILLRADLLSAVFITIISISSLLIAIYSLGNIRYERDGSRMNMYVMAFNYLVISMYLVCLIENLMAFLIAWEIMSFCSFLLVITEHEKLRTVRSGLNYLTQMHLGVTLLMTAVAILYLKTGQAQFSSIAGYCKLQSDFPIFLLFFFGFGFKLSLVPFHTWSPDTYSSAPPQISAFMSGAMKKLGIYSIIRVLTFIQDSQVEIGIFLIVAGSISTIYGIINAVVQNDMKKALAYSSVENAGIIILGLGIGFLGIGMEDYSLAYLGLCGALLHVINHTMFKSLLFLAAGSVQNSINMMNMNQMGGLIKTMPVTAVLFLIASLSICGLPPFNGFISEFLLYGGILEGLNASKVNAEVFLLIALIVLALSGGLSIFNYTKMFGISFLGNSRTDRAGTAKEANLWLLIPQFILVLLILSVDFFPLKYISHLNNVVYMFVPKTHTFATRLFDSSQNIAHITLIFLFIVILLGTLRHFFVPGTKVRYQPVWGCGYTGKTNRMQYTSSSFSHILGVYAAPLLGSVRKNASLSRENIFPGDQTYETQPYDLLERNLVKKFIARSEHFMQYFAFLQTGRLQHYIIYGFAFMFLLFILTFTNII